MKWNQNWAPYYVYKNSSILVYSFRRQKSFRSYFLYKKNNTFPYEIAHILTPILCKLFQKHDKNKKMQKIVLLQLEQLLKEYHLISGLFLFVIVDGKR